MNPTTNAVTITGTGKICAVVNGKSYTVAPDHKNYDKIIESIRSSDYDSFVKLVDVATAINKAVEGTGIVVSNGQVLFNGVDIHNTLTTRIIKFMHEGLPFLPLCKFLENLMQNPSFRAVTELYNFLEVGELPITEDGHFLAFKNVKADYFDIHSGKYRNMVGDTPSMPRNMVDEDKNRTCSKGLHFCSIKYLTHYSGGSDGHTMIVKVNPRDVVSIPADYNNTKARACTYEVVGEYLENWREKIEKEENGFNSPLYSSDGGDYDEDDENEYALCSECHEPPTNYDDEPDICKDCENNLFTDAVVNAALAKAKEEKEEKDKYGSKPSGHKFYNKRNAYGRFA